MRRAEERRSASVMISNSIKWSFAGNEVDWMTKASEPRTFSWISTKISMSAKRRTTALVSGRSRPCAMACARAGLELPATSLMEPFLADMDASSRALLDTMFNIKQYPLEARLRRARKYQAGGCNGNPGRYVFPAKSRVRPTVWPEIGPVVSRGLSLGIAQRRGRHLRRRSVRDHARHGRPAQAGSRARRLRRAVDHVGKSAESGLGNLPQHEVVGSGPRIPAAFGRCRFLAGKTQRPLLVGVVDVPDPGDHGLAAHDLGGEVAAHAIGSRPLAGNHRQAAQLGFGVEHADHAVEHLRRWAVDRFERDCRPGAGARRHRIGVRGTTATGTAAKRGRSRQQHDRQHARTRAAQDE